MPKLLPAWYAKVSSEVSAVFLPAYSWKILWSHWYFIADVFSTHIIPNQSSLQHEVWRTNQKIDTLQNKINVNLLKFLKRSINKV